MRTRPIAHPGHLLQRELAACSLSANRVSLDIGGPSGRVTDILNGPPTPRKFWRYDARRSAGPSPRRPSRIDSARPIEKARVGAL
jgi:hypothetical protein